MTKRTIPQIRELIGQLTEESKTLARRQLYIAEKINQLAEETRRRTYDRAPSTSKRVTAAVRASVREMAMDFPNMSHQALADAHGINPGRISEILHGKR
jgi:antitoxin component HigA of HigAB toxin-antitoxin module